MGRGVFLCVVEPEIASELLGPTFDKRDIKSLDSKACCGSFGHTGLAFPAHYTHVA